MRSLISAIVIALLLVGCDKFVTNSAEIKPPELVHEKEATQTIPERKASWENNMFRNYQPIAQDRPQLLVTKKAVVFNSSFGWCQILAGATFTENFNGTGYSVELISQGTITDKSIKPCPVDHYTMSRLSSSYFEGSYRLAEEPNGSNEMLNYIFKFFGKPLK